MTVELFVGTASRREAVESRVTHFVVVNVDLLSVPGKRLPKATWPSARTRKIRTDRNMMK